MIITILRKPLEGSVADNTLKHGCGSINIDATRVSFDEGETINFEARQRQQADPREKGWSGHVAQVGSDIQMYKEKGRWPANFILIGDFSVKELDRQSGHQKSGVAGSKSRAWGVEGKEDILFKEGWKAYGSEGYKDEGGASRFFKQFKKGHK